MNLDIEYFKKKLREITENVGKGNNRLVWKYKME